jgi:hypothetical protein
VGLLVFFIFVRDHCVIFVIVTFRVDRSQLQRITGDHLEIAAALVALHYIAFFNVVDIDIQRVIALRAHY